MLSKKDKITTKHVHDVGKVETVYRLRNYTTTYSEGQGKGTFEVEGIVRRRMEDASKETDPVLARARLTRSLDLQSMIARPDDWGVLAAQHFNNGLTEIEGPGRFIWYVQEVVMSPLVGICYT